MHPDLALVVESDLNAENLADLLDAAAAGTGIVPFVGAGLSQPFGFPQWGEFLRARARRNDLEDAIAARLAKGEYEEAAEDLQAALGDLAFEDAIRRTFGQRAIAFDAAAAVSALPALASGPVVTTNFDSVLEAVYQQAGQPFQSVVWAAQQPGSISTAVHTDEHLLWKLHGGFKAEHGRVLTRTEYEREYGHSDPEQADWQRPLPQMLGNLLAGRVLLFLGSSLEQDRTVRILDTFRRRHPGTGHYAVVEDPGDTARRRDRAKGLSNAALRPIWFPRGRYDLIGPFITFLAGKTGAQAGARAQRYASVRQEVDAQRQALADAGARQPDLHPQRVVGRPPQVTALLRGRGTYLRQIAQHLTSPTTRLVSVIGPSGIGKTAIAVNLLTGIDAGRWPQDVRGCPIDGIAYLAGRRGTVTERLFLACAQMIGGTTRAELERVWQKDGVALEDKIARLIDALGPGTYVVLIHHAEDLLDVDGEIADGDFRTLFTQVLAAPCGLRLLVTSRIRIAIPRKVARFDQQIRLQDGLPTEDGIAMLRDLDAREPFGLKDVSDTTLARVVTRLHGVPRALEVFAGILAGDGYLTVDALLDRFFGRADVVADVFKVGVSRLDRQSLRVVEALAVFGEPVPQAAIEMMLQPFEPDLDLSSTLRRLTRAQIVRVDREKGTCTLHPIDQDFAYEQCPAEGPYSRQTLHRRAAEWYASVRPPRATWRTLEAVAPVLLEFEHRVKAGLYDDAGAVLAEFDDEFGARLGYGARSLGMHLQLQGRVTNDRLRLANVLGLAHAYRRVGPLDKAVEGYREALALAREEHATAVEIEALGWMGEVFRRLGRLDEGKPVVSEAVAVARRAGDQVAVARWLGELGLTCCYRAELDEALEYAQEAYRTATAISAVDWEALAIDCLSLVHLARHEPLQAIEVGNRAIYAYQKGTWEHTVIYVLNVQGLAYLDLGQVDTAIGCLGRAYDEARAIEDIRVEGMTQFNLAHAYRLMPDVARALASAEEAVRSLGQTGGGELPAAAALLESLRARAAGIPVEEARSLVAAARASYTNPDLRHPGQILADALDLARQHGAPDIAAEAERLLAAIEARGGRARTAT